MNALFLSVYCYFKSMFNDEEGQDLIGSTLIIAVFVIVAIIGLQLLGPQVTAIWKRIGEFLAARRLVTRNVWLVVLPRRRSLADNVAGSVGSAVLHGGLVRRAASEVKCSMTKGLTK